jgi:type II restriction enzyme
MTVLYWQEFDMISDYLVNNLGDYVLGIETNFYGGGGSKLNETARSYKMLSQEADTIDGFTFVWFTDGIGWKSARGNLRETFDVMDTIYSIDDMENGVMEEIFA